ncbi:MAG: c-type cytochrome domain-containing protein, partial [Planctomycetota bacterium]|nr:c-type cytochrome domain-containing protein [Planctomycetota bacterium]
MPFPAALALILLPPAHGSPSRAEEGVDFTRDVRPLLADRCFACHGPDASARVARLRLDVRDSAVEDRGGYRVVDVEDVSASELLVRVRDDLDPMPPGPDHAPLSPEEVSLLER